MERTSWSALVAGWLIVVYSTVYVGERWFDRTERGLAFWCMIALVGPLTSELHKRWKLRR